MAIFLHIINSTGALDTQLAMIQQAFEASVPHTGKYLHLTDADVIVSNAPRLAVPELGVGGYTDAINSTIYISIDTHKKIAAESITATLDHEFYHLKRHQLTGLPRTLLERILDEGLACKYEAEVHGKPPIYARVKLNADLIKRISEHFGDTRDTDRWFFGGSNIPKWAGYSLGYTLINEYATKNRTTALKIVKTKLTSMTGVGTVSALL